MPDTILFDIDGTLFDPQKFGALIRSEFVKILKVPEDELIRANADYYANLEATTDFNPNDIVDFLSSRFGADGKELRDVFWENSQIYKDALYSEVMETLKKLSAQKQLGIFSQGNLELQTRKLNAADIAQYFNRDLLFRYERKLLDEVLDELPKDALFVDDKHDVATALASKRDIVWINRRNDEADPNIKTIHELGDLLF